ncbi:DUF748 domain-containing protein [Psychromonas aquimarina]|uniref:DUF748 domain-containing protein n=1 Tax=Psychromonas aquimarina TaxID=444919 RepID=UPI000418E70C|nr:DUF748 domain-containing protein [Psychromonas aquimarina]
MKYLQKLCSRQFYRSSLFWLLSLTAAYSLAGFLLLPNIIHKTLVEQVDQHLGWRAEIEKIEFNPYALTLTIHNLKILNKQAQEQLSFARYHMNFELRSLIEGAFTFADIELTAPSIKVEIDKNGLTNFQQALLEQKANSAPTVEAETQDKTDSALPKLLFDNINVSGGEISIVDHTPAKTVKHQLNPIAFNLKNLSTYIKEDGSYQLNIALGGGQTLNWSGTIGLAPLHSSGSLNINGIRVHNFRDYLSEQAPYTLEHALAGFNGQYEISMAGESAELKIQQSTIQINDIKLADKQQAQSFADIKAVKIGPLDFNLAEKRLQAESVKIDTASLLIERDKQGMLNILAPFSGSYDSENTTETAAEEAPSQSPFQWSIADVILTNSQVNFVDKYPSTKAQIEVNRINFNLEGLNQDLGADLPFNLSYYVNNSGKNTVNGQVKPQPLKLQAHLKINDFALPMLQPYINDLARITLEQGKLSMNGDLNLHKDQQGEIQGDFQGGFDIREFNSKDQLLKQRLVGWQTLDIAPVKVDLNPLSIAVNKVTLIKPYLRLIVTEQRSINFAQLAVDSKQADKGKSKSSSKADKKQPLPVKIDKIELKDGSAYFADLSLRPQFGTSIQNMNGSVDGLSSDNLARADVNISGTIEEYGKMLVKGKINPLSGDLYTDINADFDKIELTTLTPYSGRYAGYVIDKGKLSLNLNYKIADSLLDGHNRLILDQFELGSTVDSDESLDLPLKLALALFKDSDGIIDISLPTKGDMNDPDFAVGGLVMKAFMNVLSKAVTSPFSMIADLVGGDPDKLNSVAFAPGSAALTADQTAQLDTLAEVLNKRPQLILEIRAIVDEKQDGEVLKQIKMDKLLKESGADNEEQHKRISVLEQQLTKHNGEKELAGLQSDMHTETAAVKENSENKTKQLQAAADKYEQSLYQALLTRQPLSSLELSTLAQQRISIIKAQLIKHDKVANGQVFALQPSLDGQAVNNTISTTFTLTTK